MARSSVLSNRRKAFKAQGGRCFWCSTYLLQPNSKSHRALTAEHLTPKSRCEGQGRHSGNIVAACTSCNLKRGNTPLDQWLGILDIEIQKRIKYGLRDWPGIERFDESRLLKFSYRAISPSVEPPRLAALDETAQSPRP